MNKSRLSHRCVSFTLQFPVVGLRKALRQLLSPSRAISSTYFTESPLKSLMKMKDNFHNLHHFHLQPQYLVLTYFYEHYFLTLIRSHGIWGPAMAQLYLVPFCSFSGTCHLCSSGQLKADSARSHRGKIMRFQLLLVFQPPFRSGREEEGSPCGQLRKQADLENKPR